MATHPLLCAFRSSTPAFGAWISLPGSLVARCVAKSSPHLSWVVFDCEHGAITLQPGATEAIQAIGVDGPSVIVRVPATGASDSTSWQIKYALDAGARGVLVSTAEQAASIVADARFPPLGRRGFGSPFAPINWGLKPFEYVKAANSDVQVMVQIENKEGVANAKAIAEVPGIDVLFIGPFDLAMALGLPPPVPAPSAELEEVLSQILVAAHGAGKKCGIFCSGGAAAARRAAQGFDMVSTVTLDPSPLPPSTFHLVSPYLYCLLLLV
ncbi:hypothetical protein HWV62_17054 [Athelia sp. TMB]|nr:hypothetical protein HWV62_17054 [Athelia sp. TMB]